MLVLQIQSIMDVYLVSNSSLVKLNSASLQILHHGAIGVEAYQANITKNAWIN